MSEPKDSALAAANKQHILAAGLANRPAIAQQHQRHGVRGSGDDDPAPLLIPWVRYSDLVKAGVVRSWTQLFRLIDREGFPPGQMLSPNIRAWRLDTVEAWLADRPTARKILPPITKPRGRQRKPCAEVAIT